MNQILKQMRLGLDKTSITHQSKTENYQPEYKKMGLTPIPRQAKAYTKPSNALFMSEDQDKMMEEEARAPIYGEDVEKQTLNFEEIPFGDYILMILPNQIVMHSSSKLKIEQSLNEVISDLKHNDGLQFLDNLIVLRKLSLSVGGAHILDSDG